jgi:hypothetical protein
MDPSEALKLVEDILNAMKRAPSLKTVYQLAGKLFKPIEVLSSVDKPLSENLAAKAAEIMGASDLPTVLSKIKEAEDIVVQLKAKLAAPKPQQTWLGVSKIRRLDSYIKARDNKYPAFRGDIEERERRIMEAKEYDRYLHEELKFGKYKGFLHARLTGSLSGHRIVYLLNKDDDEAVFKDIVPHDDIE